MATTASAPSTGTDRTFVPRPIIVCGPSGSGKSTLLKRLFADHPDMFGFSVSHTTRNPRPGEVDGKDYHFTSRESMQQQISEGKFIEHAEYAGNMYGTSFDAVRDVLERGRHVILDIEMQGVIQLQDQLKNGEGKLGGHPQFIFIAPPSVEQLEERLKGRGTETDETLGKRLEAAKREMAWGLEPGNVDVVVTNDSVEPAYEGLKKAILG
ncbi:P-loop containing nucleoside triphosphate hydrolase protein [Gaertneriomyces semiglobifer]|nr:P-loop containing nucleoside triphosphate hydrolase protein [Gaertneriomyces semiglobifer]